MISHRNNNPGVKTMFNFTVRTNLFGGTTTYLRTGPLNNSPVYMVCFDNGEVRGYVEWM